MADPTNNTDQSAAPSQTAPAQSSTLPNATATNPADPAGTIKSSGPVAGPTMPITTAPVPDAAPKPGTDLSDPTKKPNMATKVLSALAGGKPTGYVQSDNGPVPVKRDWQPGELARHIVASAASLISAGIGGEQAAKNKRPFELAPGTSLGDIKDAQQEKDQAAAQKQFENKENVDKLVLQQHADAREQQDSMIRKGEYDMAFHNWQIAHDNDDLVPAAQRQQIISDMQEKSLQNQINYQKFLTKPGSQVMKGADGQDLNFASGDEAKAYVTAHPEVLHGMTNGKSKFGVVVVANPWTGATQLIDFPADRHENGLELVGAKKKSDGTYETDKDGNYIPDGTILDPKTNKPTYLTQTVTPDQVYDILSKQVKMEDVKAQALDRVAQSKKYEAEVNKYPALKTAMSLVDTGNYDTMTDAQKKIAGTFILKQESQSEAYLKAAEANFLKVSQQKTLDQATDADVAAAKQQVDEAKDGVDEALDKYNNTMGNTAGIRAANRMARDGKVFTQPWVQTDAQIKALPISGEEQDKAKTRIWNQLSPAQRAQVNPTTDTQAAAATANQTGAPSAKPHQTPAAPAPEGYTYLYDLEGVPHPAPNNLLDQYLASPQHKGWTK